MTRFVDGSPSTAPLTHHLSVFVLCGMGLLLGSVTIAAGQTCPEGAFAQSVTYNGQQAVDGLRLSVAGPDAVGEIRASEPFSEPVTVVAPDGTHRLTFSGSPVTPGQAVDLAFCFAGSAVDPIPTGTNDAFAWTLGGEAEPDTEEAEKSAPIAAVGVRWDARLQSDGSFSLSAELANLGFEDAELREAGWATSEQAPDLAELDFDGPFDWQPLEASFQLPGRTDGKPQRTAIALPGKISTRDNGVLLVRYAAAPVDRPDEEIRGVVQITPGGHLKAIVQRDAALEAASTILGQPSEDLEIARQSTARFPLTGVEAEVFKITDTEAEAVVAVAVDAGGRAVELAALEQAEQDAHDQLYGRLDPVLADALQDASPRVALPVIAWAKVDEAAADGAPIRPDTEEKLSADEIDAYYTQVDAYWNGVYAGAVQEIEGFLARRRGEGFGSTTSAPVVHAQLLPADIQALAKLESVDRLYLGEDYEDFLAIAGATVYADTLHAQGFAGQGTRLAQVEISGGVPPANPYLQTYTPAPPLGTGTGCFAGSTVVQDPNACVGGHATAVAGMIASTHGNDTGIAFDSCLYAAGSCSNTSTQLQAASDRARNWGARAINLSWGSYAGSGPDAMDRFFDNMVINHWRTVVVAAGNGDFPCWPGTGITGSPARAYSVITVGNFDDKNTSSWGDDTMGLCSSFVDPTSWIGDREKPDLAAPGTDFDSTLVSSPWNGAVGSGTSYAAPVVTGGAGLLFQSHPALAIWPEATKPVLMVSAVHNIEGPTRLSERDGAGGVVLDQARDVAGDWSSNQWGGRAYDCSSPTVQNVETIHLEQYRRTRVALNWTTPGSYSQYTTRPSADLDLQIVDPNGNIVAGSYSWDNTFEIVDFVPSMTGYYQIRVRKYRCDASPRYIGWAWWRAPSWEVRGLGWEADGAGMDIYDINNDGTPDLLMMVYDAPWGPNNFRYTIGWNLDSLGRATGGWSSYYNPPGVGWHGQGADGHLVDLDGNGRPELVLMTYDAPSGPNNFRYLVGWNMTTAGTIGTWSWTWHPQLNGVGWQGQGMGMDMLNIGGSSLPDLLHVAYDNPPGANNFRYRYRLDMNSTGNFDGGTLSCPQVNGLGWEAQGAGVTLGDVTGDGVRDMLVMAYDNPPGDNTFRYRIGSGLGSACSASWGSGQIVPGLGWEADGAEPELYDIDGDGDLELFLMAYDDPWGPNTFRYKVIHP